eukprot:428743_1
MAKPQSSADGQVHKVNNDVDGEMLKIENVLEARNRALTSVQGQLKEMSDTFLDTFDGFKLIGDRTVASRRKLEEVKANLVASNGKIKDARDKIKQLSTQMSQVASEMTQANANLRAGLARKDVAPRQGNQPTRRPPPYCGDPNAAQVQVQSSGFAHQSTARPAEVFQDNDYEVIEMKEKEVERRRRQTLDDAVVAQIAHKTGFEPDKLYLGWIENALINRDRGYLWVTKIEGMEMHEGARLFCHAVEVNPSAWTLVGRIAPQVNVAHRERCSCGLGWWEMFCKDGMDVKVRVRTYAEVERRTMNCKVLQVLEGALQLKMSCNACR